MVEGFCFVLSLVVEAFFFYGGGSERITFKTSAETIFAYLLILNHFLVLLYLMAALHSVSVLDVSLLASPTALGIWKESSKYSLWR